MLIKNMAKEDLEILSYADLTELILKEENKPLNTPTIFRKICDILGYDDEEYTNKIGDYYTSLTTDKRFVFLDTNEWDLREKTPVDIVMDEDEDEEEVDDEEMNEENQEETSEYEDEIDTMMEDEDIVDDEELDDLSILSDEELEEH